MADNLTPAQRSYSMSRIRSRANASTELKLLQLLRAEKIAGWRRHLKMPGTPDFVFRVPRVVVFVDGCFWHGCLKCSAPPKSNQSYWSVKIAKNVARDRRNRKELRARGWKVLRVWEHAFGNPSSVVRSLRKALAAPAASAPGQNLER